MGRTVFEHDNEQFWTEFYLSQATQSGHGFQGIPYQRGHRLGSFFGRLFRSILPVAKRVGTSALRTVGKEALQMGADVIGDIAQGQNIGESFKERGSTAGKNLLIKASNAARNQSGGRTGKRPVASRVTAVKKKRAKKADYLGECL